MPRFMGLWLKGWRHGFQLLAGAPCSVLVVLVLAKFCLLLSAVGPRVVAADVCLTVMAPPIPGGGP